MEARGAGVPTPARQRSKGGGCLDELVEGVVSDAEVDGPLRRAFARSLLDLELVLAARQARGTSETKSRSAK